MSETHINKYYNPQLTEAALAGGQHRTWVGGMWEEIGQLQFNYLKEQGLRPEHRLLDLGCGCFRAGIHLIDYLNPAHYFGIDISQDLLDAGYERELIPKGLDKRLPRANLASTSDFDVSEFNVKFDMVIAQSVFTHLSFNHIRQCLTRLVPHVKVGGVFYITAFLCPDSEPLSQPLKHQPGGIVTSPVRDPFHYQTEDFFYAANGLPWRVEIIGNWQHPRNQSMIACHRVD